MKTPRTTITSSIAAVNQSCRRTAKAIRRWNVLTQPHLPPDSHQVAWPAMTCYTPNGIGWQDTSIVAGNPDVDAFTADGRDARQQGEPAGYLIFDRRR